MKTSNFKTSIALAVCAIAVLMVPLVTHDGYIIQLLNIAMLNAIVVLGLNFATGWRSAIAALHYRKVPLVPATLLCTEISRLPTPPTGASVASIRKCRFLPRPVATPT